MQRPRANSSPATRENKKLWAKAGGWDRARTSHVGPGQPHRGAAVHTWRAQTGEGSTAIEISATWGMYERHFARGMSKHLNPADRSWFPGLSGAPKMYCSKNREVGDRPGGPARRGADGALFFGGRWYAARRPRCRVTSHPYCALRVPGVVGCHDTVDVGPDPQLAGRREAPAARIGRRENEEKSGTAEASVVGRPQAVFFFGGWVVAPLNTGGAARAEPEPPSPGRLGRKPAGAGLLSAVAS